MENQSGAIAVVVGEKTLLGKERQFYEPRVEGSNYGDITHSEVILTLQERQRDRKEKSRDCQGRKESLRQGTIRRTEPHPGLGC